jgi:TolB-like protein
MKKLVVLMVMITLACTTLQAAENVVPVEAKGQGVTRDLAIQNALYQAVCQVQGVAVGSALGAVGVDTSHVDIERDPDASRKTTITGPAGAVTDETKGLVKTKDKVEVSTTTLTPVTLTDARGLVKSYEVIAEKEVSPKVYEVTLKVQVYDYQSPEDTKKLRLAIFPFEAAVPARLIVENLATGTTEIRELASQGRLGEQFSQYLITMLARSEKFTVLDRDTQTAILKEKNILLSSDTPLEEKMRYGEVLGADYMVVGTVPQINITVEEKYNAAIGATTRRFTAVLEAEYRLIVGPTRQVAASDQLRIKLEDQQVKALMEKWESDRIDYREMEQNLVRRAAGQITDMVSDYLQPVRVAAVKDGGMLILNQGGKRFAEGDLLEVSQMGADVIDPDTGKSLGKEVAMIVTVKVTKILPRMSYAMLTQGVASNALVGAVCKRLRTDDIVVVPGRTSNVRQAETGGVTLPFDQRGGSQLIKDK